MAAALSIIGFTPSCESPTANFGDNRNRMILPYSFLHENGRWIVRETHFVNNPIVRDGLSGPPLHIHWQQNEFFQVEKGLLGLVRNGQRLAATKGSGTIEIPAGTRHRFWAHATSSEDLVFKVWAEPQDLDNSFDENFLRNFVGYQRDCRRANLKPSTFQLISHEL
ncbi:hypothetical protein F4808DRAFT_465521 [Astrocystis sublimbata]|nr:hypothetical protein F4808DRAFT_465516 [Astrocystis sublimbata]KAI0191080.1 hypothetical protein F4808DRAFT_465521 [Astrocystis sublimbata]